ncbi:MAG: hypothetical protein NT151_11825 [Acidobacteria bacterium]|nr:hypothetical protein [Acidobacteriota bacterium]
MVEIPCSVTLPPAGPASRPIVVDVGAIGDVRESQLLAAMLVAVVLMEGGEITVTPHPDAPTATVTITMSGGRQADLGPIKLSKNVLQALGVFA